MTGSLTRTVAIMVTWSACLYGALAISKWQGDLDHAICGPWGCGPRLPPLLACHVAWLVMLALPAGVVVASRRVSPMIRCMIGGSLMGVASIMLAGFFAWHLLVWWPQAADCQRDYFWQRYAFMVVTAIDVPAAELFLIGLAIWIAGRVTGRRSTAEHAARENVCDETSESPPPSPFSS
jgi:hypothetical protein